MMFQPQVALLKDRLYCAKNRHGVQATPYKVKDILPPGGALPNGPVPHQVDFFQNEQF